MEVKSLGPTPSGDFDDPITPLRSSQNKITQSKGTLISEFKIVLARQGPQVPWKKQMKIISTFLISDCFYKYCFLIYRNLKITIPGSLTARAQVCNLSTLRILYIRTLRQKLVNEIDLVESARTGGSHGGFRGCGSSSNIQHLALMMSMVKAAASVYIQQEQQQ